MSQNADPDLNAERELVMAQIGRSVCAYQRLEHILKRLVRDSDISFPRGTPIEEFIEAHRGKVENKTMGCVAGELFEGPLGPDNTTNDERKSSHKGAGVIRLRTHLQLSDSERAKLEQELAALVSERNALVHKSLLSMDLDSIEGCRSAVRRLAEQRERTNSCSDLLLGFFRTYIRGFELLRNPEISRAIFYGGTFVVDEAGTFRPGQHDPTPRSESDQSSN